MSDFLLELLSEEIPARMQAKACKDLQSLFEAELEKAGLEAESVETYATPRRLALIARGLPAQTEAVSEELKGPRAAAPPQALEGFLRKTGLTQDQLVERDGIWFATVEKPGRATAHVLAEAIPAIVRAFPWPKSMRWGEASVSTESLRWVRPLHGIVALLGEEIVGFEIAGIESGAATVGHRFHHPGTITIGGAHDYAEKLRACHVILDPAERRRIIAEGAARAAADAGLTLVEDEGLLAENAGLTEWPVALLGAFDPAFLDVPREVIQLTMRTNQKYFALIPPRDGEGDRSPQPNGGGGVVPGSEPPPSTLRAATSPSRGGLAPNFVCVANIDANDGGAAIVAGNERVLSARLADAKFFWEQDLKVPLADQAAKLGGIVFHEKLGTLADKVERVAKLARWLVEEGIVTSSPERGGGPPPKAVVEGAQHLAQPPLHHPSDGPPPRPGEDLAALAERAARLCKADLVTQMVGEFPELQGIIGGHLARAQGLPAAVADAIRDHYKPVGQGDEVPVAPVTVAVSLADKLDTLACFFAIGQQPSGSRDPFALRRSALGVVAIGEENSLPILGSAFLSKLASELLKIAIWQQGGQQAGVRYIGPRVMRLEDGTELTMHSQVSMGSEGTRFDYREHEFGPFPTGIERSYYEQVVKALFDLTIDGIEQLNVFFADRLKVQQREAGVRHDLIDAVFALGGEDDLVRLLARVNALQAFVETPEGADLLAGYKRAANILKKEKWKGTSTPPHPGLDPGSMNTAAEEPADTVVMDPDVRQDDDGEQAQNKPLSYTPEKEEAGLIAALDSAEPRVAAALADEDYERAMAALAALRGPVDAFFDKVTVNDPDPAKREARLDLLARIRDAVHRVADFSRIEG